MAVLKAAANGHTDCYNVWYYLLKKNERDVLGEDTFNIHRWPDRVAWYEPMDRLRRERGNDEKYNGKNAVTYRHYIISPDPKDNCDLDTLRELTKRFVEEHFSQYQVAAVYHDDNANRIAHAHVIVNNTNLLTGKRIHADHTFSQVTLPNTIQRLSYELGLSYFPEFTRGEQREPQQANRLSSIEHAAKASRAVGKEWKRPSWVAEIRLQVEKVATHPMTFDEFRAEMQKDGYDVYKTKRGYTYVHPTGFINSKGDLQNWKITGKHLGYLYTPMGLARRRHIGEEQELAKNAIRKATDWEAAMYRRYENTYLRLIRDISGEDRLEALRTMTEEGVRSIPEFEKVRGKYGDELAYIEARQAELDRADRDDAALLTEIDTYRTYAPIAQRLNDYAADSTAQTSYQRYLETHKDEIKAFESARDTLAANGITSLRAMHSVEDRRTDRRAERSDLITRKFDINERLLRLGRAENLTTRIRDARKTAQSMTTAYYAHRKKERNAKTESERVELRKLRDEHGKDRYAVIREKRSHVQKCEVSRQGNERALQRQIQMERARSTSQQEQARERQEQQQQQQQQRKPKQI